MRSAMVTEVLVVMQEAKNVISNLGLIPEQANGTLNPWKFLTRDADAYVYLLYTDKLMYVGMSSCLDGQRPRISAKHGGLKEEKVLYCMIPRGFQYSACQVERHLIEQLDPVLNVHRYSSGMGTK